MQKERSEFSVNEDESLQSLKRARTDSTDNLGTDSDANGREPAEILFGHTSNFFQTPKQPNSPNGQNLSEMSFDPDLFEELDLSDMDALAELLLFPSVEGSDQTMSAPSSSQTAELTWDDISANFDLEFDSDLFEFDETTFKM